ncbi:MULTISPECIES: helix-turn-helix transcriptional regulator [unclassified Paenibacillus]|uniref:helix-turn-helix domain-containing protein n=1 Tax=unclassified Paenibacillus TaxID=185978 RepID=UPI0024746322|nr:MULTISPECIES: helix-turn-helix transcriptional regulator [unclassified Paenibacillus]
MSEMMKKVGEAIRHFRKEKGMSQEELAHASGVHESYVGKLERAEKVCSVDVLAKVTGALDISLTDFFRYLQPEGSQDQETTLGIIVDKLRDRSVQEQKKILRVIDAVLDDGTDD